MNNMSQNTDLLYKLFRHTLSDDPHVRAAAYLALSNFKPDDSIKICLLTGLEDENAAVRRAAGSVLIELGYLNAAVK